MGRLWGGWRHWGRPLVVGSNDGEDGGEKGEPVEHPVQHRQPEDLEEGDEKGDIYIMMQCLSVCHEK